MNIRLPKYPTNFIAFIGFISGLGSIGWNIYSDVQRSRETLEIEWNIYPSPASKLLSNSEDHLEDGIRLGVVNKSHNIVYIKKIELLSSNENCAFKNRLTDLDKPLKPLNPWSYNTYVFKDFPDCVNLYKNRTVELIVYTTKSNTFSSSFSPVFGAFNKQGKFIVDDI
jgi:hypothetical protein